MTQIDTRRPEESHTTDDRYAGFQAGDAFVLYDTRNGAAWIQSDATVDPEELV